MTQDYLLMISLNTAFVKIFGCFKGILRIRAHSFRQESCPTAKASDTSIFRHFIRLSSQTSYDSTAINRIQYRQQSAQ